MTLGFNEINLEEKDQKKIVFITFKGKVNRNDYDLLVPQLEGIIRKGGNIRLLIELRDFEGWTLGALWEDAKFSLMHVKNIVKFAIVGGRKWEKTLALFIKPFVKARIKYFDMDQMDEAKIWIRK